MSDCIRRVYKNGKHVLTETLPNKGLGYEDGKGFARPGEKEKKKDIWAARREMSGHYSY